MATDGLKLISCAIANSAGGILFRVARDKFVEAEQEVYDFVRRHYRTYRELPSAATVASDTGVRLPTNATEPLTFYINRVFERDTYNRMRDRFADLRTGMTNRNMEEITGAVAEMSRISRQNVRRGNESLDIRQAVDLVQTRMAETRGYGGITGVETGWPRFDTKTGGYQNSDLITIVARPGVGKTYILLKQAEYAHRMGHNVLFVTTEMGIEQLGRRHISIALGIDPNFLKLNQISTHTQRRISQYYSGMIGHERMRFFAMGMSSTVSALEAYMQEFGPTIVFIDGMYLLKPDNISKNISRTERVTLVFDQLKALNLEAEIPMIGTTQFSRQAGRGGQDGSLETIGYSDSIGTHSSIVIAAKFGPTQNPRRSRWLEFLKGREGEEGRTSINFKFAPLDMEEFVPEDDDAPAQPEGAGTQQAAANVDWMAS